MNPAFSKTAMRERFVKFKEAAFAVLPISAIVLILSFTPLLSLTFDERLIFIIATILLIMGISLFNIGAEMAMTVMGEQVGTTLLKNKKVILAVIILFVMGVLITIAEPDLAVLSRQLNNLISGTVLQIFISLGVGIFLIIGVFKILTKADLTSIIMFMYLLLFALVALMIHLGGGSLLALSFDSGGVTTGPITVPFIIALGVGMSTVVGGRGKKENSFGLVSLCSIGPILAVLILACFVDMSKVGSTQLLDLSNYSITTASNFLHELLQVFVSQILNVGLSVGLIVGFFLIINFIFIHLSKKYLFTIAIGVIYTFIGLVIFLTAVEIGFLPIGFKMGQSMASYPGWSIAIAFVLGFLTVLAEPAVHVLTKQVEDITTGAITRRQMLLALCIGVGLSILLSIVRIIFDFPVLYYLIPGYIISIGLSIFVPKIYTAIAFDSGGVASGPLTSSFILPFAIGFCSVFQPDRLLEDAFGIVAMVAMTPLITIQFLGFSSIIRNKAVSISRSKIISSLEEDEVLIKF